MLMQFRNRSESAPKTFICPEISPVPSGSKKSAHLRTIVEFPVEIAKYGDCLAVRVGFEPSRPLIFSGLVPVRGSSWTRSVVGEY